MNITKPAQPEVQVLMCTKNGEKFLEDQLLSLYKQKGVRVKLHVSDDGSTDQTKSILQSWATPLSMSQLRQGPLKGAAANFLSLVVDSSIEGQWFSFCDQDDIWEPEKLVTAVSALQNYTDVPALYCSHSMVINEKGTLIGRSKSHKKPPSFQNAFVQNISSGHTMVFNHHARKLMANCGIVHVRFYDWWAYILITFAGGKIIHDSASLVRYRQHDGNDIGPHVGKAGVCSRLKRIMNGTFRDWTAQHIAALNGVKKIGTPENRAAFRKLKLIHSPNLLERLRGIAVSNFYRQSSWEQAALRLAIILNRV